MGEATSNEKGCCILRYQNNLALENFSSFTSLNFLREATPKEKQTTSVLSVANVGYSNLYSGYTFLVLI